MHKRALCFVVIILCAAAKPAPAWTVYCSNCSNQFVQMLERVTNVEQLSALWKQYSEDVTQTAQQIRMVQQNIEQYQNMISNTANIPPNLLNRMVGDFKRLSGYVEGVATRKGEIEGLRQIYTELFPDNKGIKGMLEAKNNIALFQDNWDKWANQVDQAAMATFQLSGSQLAELRDADELDDHISQLLTSPTGRMQALQAGNQLAAIQIKESRALRGLMATYIQESMLEAQKGEKTDQSQEEARRKLFSKKKPLDSYSRKPNTPNTF